MEPNGIKTTGVNNIASMESSGALADTTIERDTVDFMREPPPPYAVSGAIVLNPRPVPQQTVIVQPTLKRNPIIYNCSSCGETVITKVEHVNTQKTHMCAGFVCGCTMWCLLCCLGAIPYMLQACKKSKHYCPNCNHFLGDYSKV